MDMSGKNRKQDLEKNVSIPFVSGQNVRIHGCLNTVVESSNRPNNVLYFQHNELKVIIETALKKMFKGCYTHFEKHQGDHPYLSWFFCSKTFF